MICTVTFVVCDGCRARLQLPFQYTPAEIDALLARKGWMATESDMCPTVRHQCRECVARKAGQLQNAES